MDFYWFSLKTWIINTQHSFIRRKLTWINKVSSLWWKFHEYPWKPSLFAAKKLKYRHAIIKLFFSFTFRRISRFALTTQFEFWCSYSIDMKKPADKIESEKLFLWSVKIHFHSSEIIEFYQEEEGVDCVCWCYWWISNNYLLIHCSCDKYALAVLYYYAKQTQTSSLLVFMSFTGKLCK